MSRGRKTNTPISSNWEGIFWKCLPTYIKIINQHFENKGCKLIEVGESLQDLSFSIPKGLVSKEIIETGTYPVISQSKDYIIGYSNRKDLLINEDLPLILFGDHSKTIKYVDTPFIIGADGVKLLKPKKGVNERLFYYLLHGVITDTKDYGRHFKLLRAGEIANIEDAANQQKVVDFLDSLKDNTITNAQTYFDYDTEQTIFKIQNSQLQGNITNEELNVQLGLLSQLRQSFLREAMQGKLIKQDPKDGHAKDLLEKIKAEKTKSGKKEKELPPIKPEEIPFEIPDNWVWCRLGEICNTITKGSSPKWQGVQYVDSLEKGILFITSKNVNSFKIDLTESSYVESKFNEIEPRSILKKGDLLTNIVGASIGRTALYDLDYIANINQAVCILRIEHSFISKAFLLFLMNSNFIIQLMFKMQFAPGRANLSMGDLANFPIPLPPLQEQNRIVTKVDELMKLCDGLQESIQASREQNELLLQQVLKEALKN